MSLETRVSICALWDTCGHRRHQGDAFRFGVFVMQNSR